MKNYEEAYNDYIMRYANHNHIAPEEAKKHMIPQLVKEYYKEKPDRDENLPTVEATAHQKECQ